MAAPFAVYFAGIGTVVAALGAGFGGAYFLMNTNTPPKESSALPEVRYESTTVTKVEKSPEAQSPPQVAEPQPESPQSPAATTVKVETTGAATPNPGWVSEPPPQASTLPVMPYTAPISTPVVPPASPSKAFPVSEPTEPVRVPDQKVKRERKPASDRKTIAEQEKKRRVVVESKTEAEADDDDQSTATVFSSGPPRLPSPFFLFGN